MDALIAIWTSLAPGIIGASIGILLEAKSSRPLAGRSQIAASTGGLLGYLAFAFFLYQGLLAGIDPYTPLVAISISMLAGMLAILALSVTRWDKSGQRVSAGAALIWAMIVAVITAATYQHFVLPVQGWDVIDFWSYYAHWTLMEPSSPPQSTKPHPITIVLLQSWSAWCSQESGSSNMIMAPWLFIAINIGIGLYGYSLLISQSKVFSALMLYCLLTIPLLENHTLIAGYAEIFLSATCVLSVIWFLLSLFENSLVYAAFGVVTACLAVFIKNTCLFYSAALILTYACTQLYLRNRRLSLLVGLLFLLCSAYLLALGFSVEYFGLKLSLEVQDESWVLHAAGWEMPFVYNGLSDVIRNEIYSLLLNMSFIVIPVTSVLIIFLLKGNREIQGLFLHCSVLLLMLAASQLFFDYAFKHAVPSSDTGNSRFSLPLIAISVLLLPHVFSAAAARSGQSTYGG